MRLPTIACQLLQRASSPEKEKETDDEHDDGNNDLAGGTIWQLALFVDRYRSARRAGHHFRLSKTVYPNVRCTALSRSQHFYPPKSPLRIWSGDSGLFSPR